MHIHWRNKLVVFFALFLTIFGDGFLFTQLHHILMPHRICLIHGEVIHTDVADLVHEHTQNSSAVSVSGSIIASSEKSKPHHHEHCTLCVNRPTLLTHSPSFRIIELLRQAKTQQVIQSFVQQFNLILLSPKTSPPQAAFV